MKKSRGYIRTVNITGWIIFILTTFLYIFTMYPTIAFWDCAEFVTSSSTLQVGHQPGSPLYQVIGALFSVFAFGNEKLVPILVNSVSAICSGISIMMLFHIFLYLFNKYSVMYVGNVIAAVIASLTFALTDSFWTSSCEAEVYTLSFLFTVLCINVVIRWDEKPDTKWIILLCLLLGMSYAVHPLGLLVIPALVLIIWFHYRKISWKNLFLAALIACGVLLCFIYAFPLWLLFTSPAPIVIGIAAVVAAAFLIWLSVRKQWAFINSAVLSVAFFLIGASVYNVIIIRGSQPLPMNEYRITDCRTLYRYIQRDSYQKAPLLYGPYYTAMPCDDFTIKGNRIEPVFSSKEKTLFPRMWNYTSPSYEDGYVSWVGLPEDKVEINGEERAKPTFLQNIEFFAKYQVGYMYLRYLLWNFSGRTNDLQGYGDITNGQWQTGYIYTDKLLHIDEGRNLLSKRNFANNRYFAVPLILCLLGIFYHIAKDSKRFLFVATVFIMYSLAIVVYTNQAAYEPRERDYSYLPSYMAVSIWIGIGILGVSQIIANIIRVKKPRYILPIFLVIPVWMFMQNYNDHNHSGQYTARNFAVSMLSSCEQNAILFVDGDNDTYPLWYAQNVEHIRQDVRVINRELLNSEFNIDKLYEPYPKDKALKTVVTKDGYRDGCMDEVQIMQSFDTLDVVPALKNMYNGSNADEKFGEHIKTLPGNTLRLHRNDGDIVFTIDELSLNKSDVILLDIIASNPERPVYFSSYSNDSFLGLDSCLALQGFAYKLVAKPDSESEEIIAQKAGYIDAKAMYDNILHGFSFENMDRKLYFNEVERSFCLQYVENMSALAYKLVQEGETDKARTIVNTICDRIPYSIHYYPYSLSDMAMVYALVGENTKAKILMDRSMDMFENYMTRYNHGTVRYQAQMRTEMEKAVAYCLNLCILSEEWGLEDMRITVSDEFFSVIRPYMEICFRQKRIMSLEDGWYQSEIERMDGLLEQIYDLGGHYEEELPVDNTDNIKS